MMLASRKLSFPLLTSLVLCTMTTSSAQEKKIVADIRGKITNVSPNQTGHAQIVGTIRVEGKVEKDTGFDKASIRITNETVIERKGKDGKRTREKFSAFKDGQFVESSFTGPVAESYPVQANAKSVLILAD